MDGRAAAPSPENVLIIRPSALGDVCRSVPILVSLRAALPDARIDWLVHDAFQDAVRHHPALNDAVPFPREMLSRALRTGRGAGNAMDWLRALRRRRYDLVLDLQGLLRSGLTARLSGARRRIGFTNTPELACLFYNRWHWVSRRMHSVDRMLTLVERSGYKCIKDMRLYAGDDDRAWLDRYLEAQGIPPGSGYACLAPTARWRCKCWPLERYAAVARRLLDAGSAGEHILVLAAPDEQEQVAPLPDLLGPAAERVHFPATTVGQFLAVIERSRLLVSNDSAAMHAAVGFDRPVVAIFGPTRPELVGPYGRADSVVVPGIDFRPRAYRRRPHDQTLISHIPVEAVWEKVVEQMEERGGEMLDA